MAAPVSFSRWFGSFFLRNKPGTQRGLTLPQVREDRLDVEVMFRRELLTYLMDFRDNRVFPHDIMLP